MAAFRQRQEGFTPLLLWTMDSIESLPLFPLPDVVLLPRISVPLRLFEPRYLQMVRDALAGPAQIGMVTVRPTSLAELAGDPPIFAVGCLGQISQAQEQPDGTFQILLLGQSRFRIMQEEDRGEDRLYRSATVELLEDELPSSAEAIAILGQQRGALIALIEKFVHRIGRGKSIADMIEGFERLEATDLINSLTRSLALEPIERQQLLEADSILSRFEMMCDLLRFRLAESGGNETGSMRYPN